MRFATQKRRRPAALLALALAGGLALTPAAPAQPVAAEAGIFTAYGVPVDATAETAAAAREIALVQGQRAGLAMVLHRLTPSEDWPRIPAFSDAEIAGLVDGLQFEEEKTSAVRYLAKLIVEFRPDRVRELLRSLALPFTESRAQPTLVLPVLRRGDGGLLFEEENLWFQAWSGYRAPPGSLFPLAIPIGDLEDVSSIDAGQALRGDAPALERIARRYGAANVLVAVASLGGGPSLALDLEWHGPSLSLPVLPTVTGEASADLLLARAVPLIADALAERWKRETLLQFGEAATLSARLPIEGLRDWVAVRKLLERNGMVRRVEVASISKQSVQLWLHYLGQPEQLKLSLAQDRLDLAEENGFWILRRRDGAGGAAKE